MDLNGWPNVGQANGVITFSTTDIHDSTVRTAKRANDVMEFLFVTTKEFRNQGAAG
jgi:hypothetical protein